MEYRINIVFWELLTLIQVFTLISSAVILAVTCVTQVDREIVRVAGREFLGPGVS